MSRDPKGGLRGKNPSEQTASTSAPLASTSHSQHPSQDAVTSTTTSGKTNDRPLPVRSGQGLGVSHAQAGYAKPSMWQAPQSLLYPTAPAPRTVTPERAATYFRRVAMPHRVDGPPPAPWQRRAQVMGGVFSAVTAVYMVFFHDFGPKEHVFTRLREIVGSERMNPFRPSDEELQWAARRAEAERTTKVGNHSGSRMV